MSCFVARFEGRASLSGLEASLTSLRASAFGGLRIQPAIGPFLRWSGAHGTLCTAQTTLGPGYPFALVTTLQEFVAQSFELGRPTDEKKGGSASNEQTTGSLDTRGATMRAWKPDPRLLKACPA